MSIIEALRPHEKHRIYDLVRAAGVDVSDWERSKGKAKSAAANPKYCYNWSFIVPGKLVVLNLWHNDVEEHGDVVTLEWNARDIAEKSAGVTVVRATAMDSTIREAFRASLPVRVVLCDGTRRNRDDPNSSASRVKHRLLDLEPWHVQSYDARTGDCVLRRGLLDDSKRYIDQFDLPMPPGGPAEKVPTTGHAYLRRPEVRRFALARAKGRCEYCGEAGFAMPNGRLFLETHHVIPLHESGPDSPDNVAALCPNHHREAHHGVRKVEIRKALQKKLHSISKASQD